MDCAFILAQTGEAGSEAAEGSLVPIQFIWDQVIGLSLVEALTFCCFGVVCLFYGWRIFKILVTLCFGLVGLVAGLMLNEKLIGGDGTWLGLIGMVMMVVVSIPMMRWGVCALGAAAGGILSGGVWYAFELPGQYIWAGALAGAIAGGMISFIVFKLAVVLFTSFGGGTLIVTALLAILHRYMVPADRVQNLVFNHHWFLPVALFVPTIAGIIIQNKFIKGSKEWHL